MKNGMTFQEAFELEDVWADALAIAFGEFAGGEWDWRKMAWKKVET